MIQLELTTKHLEILQAAVNNGMLEVAPNDLDDWHTTLALLEDTQRGSIVNAYCELCEEPFSASKAGRKGRFCSNKCRQTAYRRRKRTQAGVATEQSATNPDAGSVTKQNVTQPEAQATVAPLIYLRKGGGVVHLSVNRLSTLCRREAEGMEEVKTANDDQVCQRCAHVRDTQTWWQGYRQAFGYE